jgi:GTPase
MTGEEKKIVPVKSKRRGLVAAQEAAVAEHRAQSHAERAVLVAVEFTGERRRLTSAARMARGAAAVTAGSALDDGGVGDIRSDQLRPDPQRVADLDWDASLAEFEELARSAGAEVTATLIQRRPRPDPATLVGQGKLDEIEAVTSSTGADLVLFDHDLTPSQLRNLEARLPCRVIDRTQLILDIFARHARTREGQLQVELAQLEYQLPRLAGRGKAMSQLGGGIGTRGPGETQLETDRRKINLRIDHVKEQLESVRRIRHQQRQRREAVPVPVIEVLNKIDLLPVEERERLGGAGSVAVSGLARTGLHELLKAIDRAMVVDPLVEARFRLPQSEGAVLAALEAGAIVEEKRFEGNLVFLTARGPASLLNRYRRFRERATA